MGPISVQQFTPVVSITFQKSVVLNPPTIATEPPTLSMDITGSVAPPWNSGLLIRYLSSGAAGTTPQALLWCR